MVQNTFTLVPEGPAFGAKPVDEPTAPRKILTSKQVEKAYRQRTRPPKLSKAEQRRQELLEQDRIRRELEREKNLMRAQTAREKKKQKQEQLKSERRKKGLPLVQCRPSQDTIARFVRGNASGKKRDSAGKELQLAPICENAEGNAEDDNAREDDAGDEDGADKENGAQVPRQPELPGEILKLDFDPLRRMSQIAASKRRRTSPSPPSHKAPESLVTSEIPAAESKSSSGGTDQVPDSMLPDANMNTTDDSVKNGMDLDNTVEDDTAELFTESFAAVMNSISEHDAIAPNPLVHDAGTHGATDTTTEGKASACAPLSGDTTAEDTPKQPPALATRRADPAAVPKTVEKGLSTSMDMQINQPASHQAKPVTHGKKVSAMPPPPAARNPLEANPNRLSRRGKHQSPSQCGTSPFLPPTKRPHLSNPRPMAPPPLSKFKTPSPALAASSTRPKFLPKQTRSGLRAPSALPLKPPTVTSNDMTSAPPTSTQLFVMNHLDDLFPSPSQQELELEEDVPCPSPRRIKAEPAERPRPTAHVAVPNPIEKPPMIRLRPAAAPVEEVPFFSSQDFLLSTQDLREVECSTTTPSRIRSDNLVKTVVTRAMAPSAQTQQNQPRQPASRAPTKSPPRPIAPKPVIQPARAQDPHPAAKPVIPNPASSSSHGHSRCTPSLSMGAPLCVSNHKPAPPKCPQTTAQSSNSSTSTVESQKTSQSHGREPKSSGNHSTASSKSLPQPSLARPRMTPPQSDKGTPGSEDLTPPQRFFGSSGVGYEMLLAQEQSRRAFRAEQRQRERERLAEERHERLAEERRRELERRVEVEKQKSEDSEKLAGSSTGSKSGSGTRIPSSAHRQPQTSTERTWQPEQPKEGRRVLERQDSRAERAGPATAVAAAPVRPLQNNTPTMHGAHQPQPRRLSRQLSAARAKQTYPGRPEQQPAASQETDYGDFDLGADGLELLEADMSDYDLVDDEFLNELIP